MAKDTHTTISQPLAEQLVDAVEGEGGEVSLHVVALIGNLLRGETRGEADSIDAGGHASLKAVEGIFEDYAL